MHVLFDQLPSHSRIWVYQADRKISSSEKDIISSELFSFTEQWQVHGQPMKASFKIYFDQFIVLAADEGYNVASGCSIDGSVRTLKGIGSKFGLDFFNKNIIAFKKEEQIELVLFTNLKQKLAEGFWNEKTLTFNNVIGRKDELDKAWILPASETWLKRYLSSEMAKH